MRHARERFRRDDDLGGAIRRGRRLAVADGIPRQDAAGSANRRSLEGRFPPGTLLASRYRIVALVGSGGMGDVYRAEDLVLDQSVALKFLPDAIAADADRIERFRAEVRVAPDVSHPNVCRVYDIGETGGHPSALAVAAALPGGDPLAAALAAGETPSPEMVAAAGGVGALSPGVALAGAVARLPGALWSSPV